MKQVGSKNKNKSYDSYRVIKTDGSKQVETMTK